MQGGRPARLGLHPARLTCHTTLHALRLLQRLLELLRLHNSTYNLHGQIITAKVLDMDRKKILIDTGIKIAKIAHSDIRPECIVGTTRQDDAPRKPGERLSGTARLLLGAVGLSRGLVCKATGASAHTTCTQPYLPKGALPPFASLLCACRRGACG